MAAIMHEEQDRSRSPQTRLPLPSVETSPEGLKGFRRKWGRRQVTTQVLEEADFADDEASLLNVDSQLCDDDVIPSPSLPEQMPSSPVPGLTTGREAWETAVSASFARNAQWSDIKMPWEKGPMKLIFGDAGDDDNLLMPCHWNAASSSMMQEPAQVVSPEVVATADTICAKGLRTFKDATFEADREKVQARAIDKWLVILEANLEASSVGKSLTSDPSENGLIMKAVCGTKSPNTIMSRANAFLAFMRWHTCNKPDESFLPVQERNVWSYLSMLHESKAPATRGTSLVQSLRFAHYVLGIEGCLEAASSRRVSGLAELLLCGKKATKQARPLTVQEVRTLHDLAEDPNVCVVDRVMASHCLLMLYGRCRHSDTVSVKSIEHDHVENSGFVQLNVSHHKGNRTLVKKSLLLPVLIPAAGVAKRSWVDAWWVARTEAGLPTVGEINGPLLPAPKSLANHVWAQRPVTCSEISMILRHLLGLPSDELLSSHSLKTTCLSWCAKYNVGREERRLLGRHSSTIQEADSYYARDLMYGPVQCLAKVLESIRGGFFVPDAPRTFFRPEGTAPSTCPMSRSGVPLTPVPLDLLKLAKATDGETPVEPRSPSPAQTIKSEPWSAFEVGNHIECIDVSSTSSSDTSDCEAIADSSDDERDVEPEPSPVALFVPPKPLISQPDKVLFKHNKTKTVHCAESQDSQLTKCGRRVSDVMSPVASVADWPMKCRVCFHGCRSA